MLSWQAFSGQWCQPRHSHQKLKSGFFSLLLRIKFLKNEQANPISGSRRIIGRPESLQKSFSFLSAVQVILLNLRDDSFSY